jgi:hypothetical protein
LTAVTKMCTDEVALGAPPLWRVGPIGRLGEAAGLCVNGPADRARPDHHGWSIYLGCASTRWMVATRLSNSIGLASNSSHPWQWLLAFALHRIRGHADDRDVVGMRIVLEAPHGIPAVNAWHFEVHQDYVRVFGQGQLAGRSGPRHSMTSSAMASSVGGMVRPRHKRACYSLIVRTTLEVGRLSLAGPFTCLRIASS